MNESIPNNTITLTAKNAEQLRKVSALMGGGKSWSPESIVNRMLSVSGGAETARFFTNDMCVPTLQQRALENLIASELSEGDGDFADVPMPAALRRRVA